MRNISNTGIGGRICVLAFAVICLATMLGAGIDGDKARIEYMLKQRSIIMESVLLGKITYNSGRAKLKEIESDALLNSDLESLKNYEDTDLDTVDSMCITDFETNSNSSNIQSYICQIMWTQTGYDGSYQFIEEYVISTTIEDGEYKLISLSIAN